MKIAIQGQQGSYHDQVRREFYGTDSEALNCHIFPDVFRAIISGGADAGIIAFANNRYGFIPEPYALLLQDAGKTVQIAGEYYLKIRHYLVGIPGAKLKDITEIHSQTPALGQCQMFLESEMPQATIIEEEDTAYAAKRVAELGQKHRAAIASEEAGKLHGLASLKAGVQDDAHNLTRFLIISKPNGVIEDANKTSILLETGNQPGSLADVLVEFKRAGINLDLLHSSFIANTNFTMKFFLEFDAGWHDPATRETIKKITADHGAKVTRLGSYKSGII